MTNELKTNSLNESKTIDQSEFQQAEPAELNDAALQGIAGGAAAVPTTLYSRVYPCL